MKWKTWDEQTAKTTSVRLFAAGSWQLAGPTRKRLCAGQLAYLLVKVVNAR